MTSDDIADCREADAPLIAAAPDLAQTVIDQAEEIGRLTRALWIEQNQDPGDY